MTLLGLGTSLTNIFSCHSHSFSLISTPPPPPPPPPFTLHFPSLNPTFTLSIRRKNLEFCARSFGYKGEPNPIDLMESGKESTELGFNRNLYPQIEPYSTGFLKVSNIHTIYWEQSGNPDGHPVVFLHGGPGGGTAPSNRRFFDPDFYRIILFDQRGAGKSTPHACLVDNTTWDLIDDIEKLRKHLEIPEWQVFGGSWGSTLALAYSQSHPDKVNGLVLRGIFLLRKKEMDWFYEGGAAAIFPDGVQDSQKWIRIITFSLRPPHLHPQTESAYLKTCISLVISSWEPFRDLIPENERSCFIDAYGKRLNSDVMETQYAAARAWTKWEMMTAHLLPNEENIKRGDDDKFSLAFAKIENHYFVNKGFFSSDSFLLDNVDKIRHINTTIVQGRYDVCCPMMSAWDLHKAWPEADFKVVPNAGHSANELGIAAELVAANEKLKNLVKNNGR
ncbi:hypothetical protein Dsin_024517 [Dipteronia sinensis]|uniref:Proline iminopeptidase n=1 Tax=Dipteronia sinensis TaxID=43782 RepID=A0AAD9ZU53_9ROSI|nr:hypothetical protein Dsin_024517 [Dipteronia sinensis]